MGQVVFLPRPESWGAFWAVITHNIGLPRSGTGLILARNGALGYIPFVYVLIYLAEKWVSKSKLNEVFLHVLSNFWHV